MLIVHGTYRFGRKRIGYRNDFCLTCEAERVAEQWRSFDALHLFFVPVVPLGFPRRWLCATCGKNPHERVKTSKAIAVAGSLLLLLVGASFWSMPAAPDDAAFVWIARVLMPLLGLACLVASFKVTPAPNLKERLQKVPSLRGDICPYCKAGIVDKPVTTCGGCGIERSVAR